MGKYHRWFSIAASVVFIVGMTDAAMFVKTNLNSMFESLIPISVPGTTELSFKEAGLYTVFLHIPPGDRFIAHTIDLTMKSKSPGALVQVTVPQNLRWYMVAGEFLNGERNLEERELQIPYAGMHELNAKIKVERPGALGSYLIGYNWAERWSQTSRVTAIGLSGWLSGAALLAFIGYVKRPSLPIPQAQRRPVESDSLASESVPILHRLHFHGTGAELFGIFLVNVLFTLVTLGIYSFWAKVRTRKYIWSQTEFAGERLGFHGTGQELLIGWFKAAILFGGFVTFTSLLPILWSDPRAALIGQFLLSLTVLLLLVPIARIGAMRYRLSRTSWRGIRFSFGGRYPPFLGLSLRGLLFTVVTAGLYYPTYQTSVRRYLVDHSSFGSVSFKFDGDGGELTGRFMLAALLTIPTLGLIWIWYAAQRRRFYWNHTSFAGARFHSTVTGKGLLSLYAINLLIIVLSLGFALPWATVRTKRYDLDHLVLEGVVDLDRITQQAQNATPAADELAGFLDVDVLPG